MSADEPVAAPAEATGPYVGELVCDCQYKHQRIVEVLDDDVILEDGLHCSYRHCCDPVPHEWEHPDEPA